MERNKKDIELFGDSFVLYERSAQDVLSLSEFVTKNKEATLGAAVYQSAFIVESSLKLNKKELPEIYPDNFVKKLIRKFIANIRYNEYVKKLNDTLTYNSKIKASYLLDNLSQKELFDLAKQVYLLEGIDLDKNVSIDDPTEKKS